jgi:broad specificity phosphatase PhoE
MPEAALAAVSYTAPRPGAVILARHGEPALSRSVLLSSDQYRSWWARYEAAGLAEGQAPPEPLVRAAAAAGVLIVSPRARSVETARALAGGRGFTEDPLFVEAPLPPPSWPRWLKLSPRLWGAVARFWWWVFDHHEGHETRDQARRRAEAAAGRLVELAAGGQDVLVVAHGFFNGMVGLALRRRGWRCVDDGGFRYWAARRFETTHS